MALYFNGTTDLDYVSLGQPSELSLDPTKDWSIACWVRTESNTAYGTFVGKGDGAGPRQAQLTYGSPGPPYQLQAIVGGTFYVTGVVGADGLWHHCALVNYDDAGTQRFQMYQDGAIAGSAQASGTNTQAVDVLIGARRNSGNTGAAFVMQGDLADVRIYNRILSLPEIQTMHSCRGHDEVLDGLAGRWLLKEKAPGLTATGTATVKDYSRYGNHGTPNDAPVYSVDPLTTKRRMLQTR